MPNRKIQKKVYEINTKDLAELFNVNPRTLLNWKKNSGLPSLPKSKYDLASVFLWQLNKTDDLIAKSDNPELAESQKRFWDSKADREKVKADFEKGLTVKKSDVRMQAGGFSTMVKDGLYQMIEQLAPALSAEHGLHEIKQILLNEVNHTLQNLSDALCAKGLPDGDI